MAMSSNLIASLSQSFRQIPPPAVPAFLDCLLSSTGVSPSTLYGSLIEEFPILLEDSRNGEKKFDSDCCNYIASLVAGLCHLLKKFGSGIDHNALLLFVGRVFIPLMGMVSSYDSEMLNKIVRSFFDVVIKTSAWDMLQENLVPFLLKSVGVSVGMLRHEESDIIKWGELPVSDVPTDENGILSQFWSFPLSLSCHLLTVALEAAFQNLQADLVAEKFAADLLWDLCNMTERLLLQSAEHRSCAVSFLLPAIFKAFTTQCLLEVSLHGKMHILSRNNFINKIWECCKKLFSVGTLERRDAYTVLSLYLPSVCREEGNGSHVLEGEAAEFDLRSEKEFWDEIEKGLVDDESLVRKQSLHILKSVLAISEVSQVHSRHPEKKSKRDSVTRGMTKREIWAKKEAKSLGVGKLYGSLDSGLTSYQEWEAFLLLYEMLEEYGTHLVEAAWSNQIDLLLKSSFNDDRSLKFTSEGSHQSHVETPVEATGISNWLEVLWNRGFCHDNPIVRCMIMESFLKIEWSRYGSLTRLMRESFVLGPFMEGLNDPIHHKDFGLKGIYSSRTIEGASRFVYAYTSCLNPGHQMGFVINLASLAKKQSFGRAGLVALVECIASSAHVVGGYRNKEMESLKDEISKGSQVESCNGHLSQDDIARLLDVLRFVVESSKQHFNPNYRIRVYQKMLEAAASVVNPCGVPLGILLQFISAFPREFTDYNGSLRRAMQEWLWGCDRKNSNCPSDDSSLLESLNGYLNDFISNHVESFDDEDLDTWELQTKKWARVLFLVINDEEHLSHILLSIQNHGVNICKQQNQPEWSPVKFLILILSILMELHNMQEGITEICGRVKDKLNNGSIEKAEGWIISRAPTIHEKFVVVYLSILEELISYADSSCLIFWSHIAVENETLPGSVRGKLGGPSQRRLSISTTTAVLEAVTSVRAIAVISSYCTQFKRGVELKFAFAFFWKFFQHTISSQKCNSEVSAEICLAAFEALTPVLNTFVSLCSAEGYNLFENNNTLLTLVDDKPWLEFLASSFLRNINDFLATGFLVRTRRAVLLNWKWLCVESLLSLMHFVQTRRIPEDRRSFFSVDSVKSIFNDILESLENAGEDSVLPMLRSVRRSLEILASGKSDSDDSSCVDIQMMWQLVNSCWILHISCNKRRVAPIAALLSSVLHSSLFGNVDMHITKDGSGPLKWFVKKVLKEGQKSPRTIRLAALHLTGLFLLYPRTIKYYIKELRFLTLYGSVAFDEDFEAELSDNSDARTEVSLLAKNPDPELTEVFINTELYARVSIAALFHTLADLAEPACHNKDCQDALESGKLFLLELLDAVVRDKDLAKELYKKYSAIHRRKIRAWQMICIMSRFVSDDTVGQVAESLHLCLYRNNLPAVRQYLETFAINIYLKFPSLVEEQLVPILKNYDMKPQALSSYVFIAANVILHSQKAAQQKHLEELLPPIIPLLTSHHHSLRGFTQLLVHQVLFRLFPPLQPASSQSMPLENRSFENLRSYIDKNPDCARLRSSMEGYLDAYDPTTAASPSGVFVNRVEENDFECVPTCLMDHVLSFLNNVREDLRVSMAKDTDIIKTEGLKIEEDSNCTERKSTSVEERLSEPFRDLPRDFQKKITLSKLEQQNAHSSSMLANEESYKKLMEMEKEDELVSQLLRSKSMEVERLKAGRQSLFVVASFLDRIPNLAGLARTCEVFKASGLAVADASVIKDKQFQLISVTAEKWVPIMEVPVNSLKLFLERKKREGFSILGLEQTANSIPLDKYQFPTKSVLVLGREKEGIPVDIIHVLDACVEIPQLGVVRSLNVHVSAAIAIWEYTRQQRTLPPP